MKRRLIQFVKNNPFLYRQAKKVTRMIRQHEPFVNREYTYMCVYMLEDLDELPLIEKHFKKIQKPHYRLVVLVKGYIDDIHQLIQENQHVTFLSMDYYEKYHSKLHLNNMYILDYKQDNPIMNYVN